VIPYTLMTVPFFAELDGGIPIARHEHVAVLYRGREDAYRYASFLAEGLKRGDLCQYLAPSNLHPEMLDKLRARVGDPAPFVQRGALRLYAGVADIEGLRAWAQGVFEEAECSGFAGVRWLEEGIWAKAVGFPYPDFFNFDALLNFLVKQYPSVALCQYDLNQMEPSHLFSAIAAHRHLLVEGTLVRDNPFYIPAEKFIPLSPAAREHDLAQLFREVGFDWGRFLAALAGFGRMQGNEASPP
jgi:hypothetical protein